MTAADRDVPYMDRATIEAQAEALRREYGLTRAPVDPIVLADMAGIKVHAATFLDSTIVGMIAKRGQVCLLLVNDNDPPYRKRFTIAHELGHFFLGHIDEEDEFVDYERTLFSQAPEGQTTVAVARRREIQANMFAAALLMPEDEVRKRWQVVRSIRELAQALNVSEEAMGIRVNQLGLE
ncbi:ImmA/IrrE family metallo-endopeptidase [Candidatus Poribacteria bacterium]|nr:ImmA/IrrE family metallo-endopeptidase [Candidatus Poribacteria bacterium]